MKRQLLAVTFLVASMAGSALTASTTPATSLTDGGAVAQGTRWSDLRNLFYNVAMVPGGTNFVVLASDYYATESDSEEDDPSIEITCDTVLDLNGHTIDTRGYFRAFIVSNGGRFTLTNSVPESGAITGYQEDGDAGGVIVNDGGVFTMNGGAITNNVSSDYGGGVYVEDGGTFVLNDGEISGNIAMDGGGVYVEDGGTFTMNGGAIPGNTAICGGGLYVEGVFTMTGGRISANAAYDTYDISDTLGGGLYIDGVFTMSGGEISCNSVSVSDGDFAAWGGGAYVAGGALVISGGVITNNCAKSGGGGVYVAGSGTLTFNGGDISGNSVTDLSEMNMPCGGGVFVEPGGTFTMNEGEISGNRALFGGGVQLHPGSTFAMSGGTISNNVANCYAGVDALGDFSMSGGLICGNVALQIAGGVYVYNDATFTMSGGTITENTSAFGGSGVYLDGSMVVFGRPVISGNFNTTNAPDNVLFGDFFDFDNPVVVSNSLVAGASIGLSLISPPEGEVVVVSGVDDSYSDYFFCDYSGYRLIKRDNELSIALPLSPWGDLQRQLYEGGSVILGQDCEALNASDRTLMITNTVVLDLNGHSIDANSCFSAIKIVQGGSLTLTNSSQVVGAVTGGYANAGGGVFVDNGGTFTMNGGLISGNVAIGDGGGVYVYNGGTFIMNGGEISGSEAVNGGGVYVEDYGVLIVNGGVISGNEASGSGGGAYVDTHGTITMNNGVVSNNCASAGAGVYVWETASFTLRDGAVSRNTADNGGGVYVGFYGLFIMEGGSIAGNTADVGGGVFIRENGTMTMGGGMITDNSAGPGGGVYQQGSLVVFGSPFVSGNFDPDNASNNVFLAANSIAVSNGLALAQGALIGVSLSDSLGANFDVATGVANGDDQYFFSDNPNYSIGMNSVRHTVYLVFPYPDYLQGADDLILARYNSWSKLYGQDEDGSYETAFLLNIDPKSVLGAGESYLKVVAFNVTNNVLHIELASDACNLFQPVEYAGTPALCNGCLTLEIALDLSDKMSRISVPVRIESGRAVIDYGFGKHGLPDAMFIRPSITIDNYSLPN